MEFNFGEKIKALRKDRGLTQEQLAELLGVSFQAISKWETNAATPDIAMFPILAGFFGVTTDELFGIDVDKTRKTIERLCKQADEMFDKRQYAEALLLMRKAVTDYPGNDELQYRLAWALTGNIREYPAYLDEAIHVYLKILEKSTDTEMRLKATRDLVYRYYTKRDIAAAKAYAARLPSFQVCREYILGRANLLEGKELADYQKSNIQLFGKAILECLAYFEHPKIFKKEDIFPETREGAKQKMELLKAIIE